MNSNLRFHYEDWEFNARLAFQGLTIEAVPVCTYIYRRVPQATRTHANKEKLDQSRNAVISEALLGSPSLAGLDYRFRLAFGAYAARSFLMHQRKAA